MAQVRLTTNNLLFVADQMAQWASQMDQIARDMKTRVNNMKDWNDARAEQFRQQATMTAQQLMLHIDNFTKMSKFLQKYAHMQEKAERDQKARMSNI